MGAIGTSSYSTSMMWEPGVGVMPASRNTVPESVVVAPAEFAVKRKLIVGAAPAGSVPKTSMGVITAAASARAPRVLPASDTQALEAAPRRSDIAHPQLRSPRTLSGTNSRSRGRPELNIDRMVRLGFRLLYKRLCLGEGCSLLSHLTSGVLGHGDVGGT